MFVSGAAMSTPPHVMPDDDATTLEMLGMSIVDQSPPPPVLYDAAAPQLSEIHQCLDRQLSSVLLDSSLKDMLAILRLILTLTHGFLALKEAVDLLGTQMDMVLYQ
jgi:hypothetical protein